MWSLAYAFLLWLAVPAGILPVVAGGMPAMGMLDTARAHFPELVAYLICFGLPLGLFVGGWRALRARGVPVDQAAFSWPRAIVVGGLAGLLGGWAFGKWMEQVNFFPLVASLVRSDSRATGVLTHFVIAVIIGISFGVLFQLDLRGFGSSLSWGAAYGLLWWFIGPLTLLPLILLRPLDWSVQHAADLFGPEAIKQIAAAGAGRKQHPNAVDPAIEGLLEVGLEDGPVGQQAMDSQTRRNCGGGCIHTAP